MALTIYLHVLFFCIFVGKCNCTDGVIMGGSSSDCSSYLIFYIVCIILLILLTIIVLFLVCGSCKYKKLKNENTKLSKFIYLCFLMLLISTLVTPPHGHAIGIHFSLFWYLTSRTKQDISHAKLIKRSTLKHQ